MTPKLELSAGYQRKGLFQERKLSSRTPGNQVTQIVLQDDDNSDCLLNDTIEEIKTQTQKAVYDLSKPNTKQPGPLKTRQMTRKSIVESSRNKNGGAPGTYDRVIDNSQLSYKSKYAHQSQQKIQNHNRSIGLLMKSSGDKTIKIEANLTPRVNIDLVNKSSSKSDDDVGLDDQLRVASNSANFEKAMTQHSQTELRKRKMESPRKQISENHQSNPKRSLKEMKIVKVKKLITSNKGPLINKTLTKLEQSKGSFRKPKEAKTANTSIAGSKVIKFKRPMIESGEGVVAGNQERRDAKEDKVLSRVSSNAAGIPVEQEKVQFVKDLYHATGQKKQHIQIPEARKLMANPAKSGIAQANCSPKAKRNLSGSMSAGSLDAKRAQVSRYDGIKNGVKHYMSLDLTSNYSSSRGRGEKDHEDVQPSANPFRKSIEKKQLHENFRALTSNQSSPQVIGIQKNSFEHYNKTKNINQQYKDSAHEMSQYSRRDNRFLKTIISQQEYETSDDGFNSKKNRMQKSNSQAPSLGFLSGSGHGAQSRDCKKSLHNYSAQNLIQTKNLTTNASGPIHNSTLLNLRRNLKSKSPKARNENKKAELKSSLERILGGNQCNKLFDTIERIKNANQISIINYNNVAPTELMGIEDKKLEALGQSGIQQVRRSIDHSYPDDRLNQFGGGNIRNFKSNQPSQTSTTQYNTAKLEPAAAAGNPAKTSLLFKAIQQDNASQRNPIKIFGKKKTLDISTFGMIAKDNTSLDTLKANQVFCHKFIDLTQDTKKRPLSNIEVNNDSHKSKTSRSNKNELKKQFKKQNHTSRHTEEPSKVFKEVSLIKASHNSGAAMTHRPRSNTGYTSQAPLESSKPEKGGKPSTNSISQRRNTVSIKEFISQQRSQHKVSKGKNTKNDKSNSFILVHPNAEVLPNVIQEQPSEQECESKDVVQTQNNQTNTISKSDTNPVNVASVATDAYLHGQPNQSGTVPTSNDETSPSEDVEEQLPFEDQRLSRLSIKNIQKVEVLADESIHMSPSLPKTQKMENIKQQMVNEICSRIDQEILEDDSQIYNKQGSKSAMKKQTRFSVLSAIQDSFTMGQFEKQEEIIEQMIMKILNQNRINQKSANYRVDSESETRSPAPKEVVHTLEQANTKKQRKKWSKNEVAGGNERIDLRKQVQKSKVKAAERTEQMYFKRAATDDEEEPTAGNETIFNYDNGKEQIENYIEFYPVSGRDVEDLQDIEDQIQRYTKPGKLKKEKKKTQQPKNTSSNILDELKAELKLSEAILKQRKEGDPQKQTDIDDYEMRLKHQNQYSESSQAINPMFLHHQQPAQQQNFYYPQPQQYVNNTSQSQFEMPQQQQALPMQFMPVPSGYHQFYPNQSPVMQGQIPPGYMPIAPQMTQGPVGYHPYHAGVQMAAHPQQQMMHHPQQQQMMHHHPGYVQAQPFAQGQQQPQPNVIWVPMIQQPGPPPAHTQQMSSQREDQESRR